MINFTKKSGYKVITAFMVVIMLVSMLSTALVCSAVDPADDTVTSDENISATDENLETDGAETEDAETEEVVLPNLDHIPELGPDTVKPVIVPVELKADTLYAVDAKMASVTINEKRGLESVKIYLNDKEIPFVVEGETYSFVIPSNSDEQNIKVVAVDTSGNKASIEVKNIIVSTSFFVRFINDTTYMITTIVIVLVVALAVFGLVILIKKRIAYRKGV